MNGYIYDYGYRIRRHEHEGHRARDGCLQMNGNGGHGWGSEQNKREIDLEDGCSGGREEERGLGAGRKFSPFHYNSSFFLLYISLSSSQHFTPSSGRRGGRLYCFYFAIIIGMDVFSSVCRRPDLSILFISSHHIA